MILDDRAADLVKAIRPGASRATVDRCTDFAIDANVAGRPDLSVSVLTRLVAVGETNARVWQLLGVAYRDQQQGAAALAAFKQAAIMAPRDSLIAAGHATAAMEAGEPSALLFKTARDLAPNDPELLLSTIAALNADGHPEVAEELLERTVGANPDWLRGHEALATLRLTTAGPEHFARSFADACAGAPENVALRLSWQRTLAQAGQWDAALAVIEGARSAFGSLAQFDAAAANIATETGDDARAELLFTRALVVDDAGTRVGHIRHCLRTGRIEQAERIATASLETQSAAALWPYLSLIWRLRGDPKAQWLDGAPPMIQTIDLEWAPTELDDLAGVLRALHMTRFHPAEQSMRGGTQTEGVLFGRQHRAIQAVRAKVLAAVQTYVAALPRFDAAHPLLGTARTQLLFSGSWSVRLMSQGFHVHHTHPLGWISSALYVALPAPDVMGAAPAGWLEIGAPPPDLRLDLPAYARIEPKPGRLVLFPSTMWHATVPFSDGERLTIAFDVATPAR